MLEFSLKKSSITMDQKSKAIKVQNQAHIAAIFDVRGMAHYEFLPQGEAFNQHIYKKILQRFALLSEEKKARFVGNNTWLLHHVLSGLVST